MDKNKDKKPKHESFDSYLLLISILVECLVLLLVLPIFPQKYNFMAAIFPSVLVDQTNEERESANLNKLSVNDLLVSAAQLKANDMASGDYFAHVTPDGKTPWYWLDQAGYKYDNAGENLAVNFIDSKDVIKAWMKSPTHKANIVRDGFKEIGIASAEGNYNGKKAVYVVQFFGKPKVATAQTIQVKPAVISTATSTKIKTVTQIASTTNIVNIVKATSTPLQPKVLGANFPPNTQDTYVNYSTLEKALTYPRTLLNIVILSISVLSAVLMIVLALSRKLFTRKTVINLIILTLFTAIIFVLNNYLGQYLIEIM